MESIEVVVGQPISSKLNSKVLQTLSLVTLMSLLLLGPFEYWMYTSNRDYALHKLKNGIQERILAIARGAALLIDGEQHYDLIGETPDWKTPGFKNIQNILRKVQEVHDVREDIYTLRLKDREKRLATFIVMSGGQNYIGNDYVYPPEMERTFFEGKTSVTDIYTSKSQEQGMWMSAFAPIKEPDSEAFVVLEVDVPVDEILKAFHENSDRLILFHSLRGAFLVFIFVLVYWLIRYGIHRSAIKLIKNPLEEIIKFINRVRDGILDSHLAVKSGDEFEVLADSFNEMVDGLRKKETMARFLTTMEMQEVDAVSSGLKNLTTQGEKRSAAILFSDIRGFTSICEREDPQRIIEALNLYFDQMVPFIEKWHGSLDKLIGDCIMAVFEESDDYNESEAALQCAIEMQVRMSFVREELKKQALPEFHVGFGINTGVSVVGNLGAKNQLSRTVLGDAVNLAARVESLSKEGRESKILFTEFTLEKISSPPLHDFLMETVVKGKTKAVKIYEIKEEELRLR